MSFNHVGLEGFTHADLSYDCAEAPDGLTIVPTTNQPCYDIWTTAVVAYPCTVCITYDEDEIGATFEPALTLQHWDAEILEWVDVTTSLDTDANIICGEVYSLSPFVMALPCKCPFQADFDEDGFLTALDLGRVIDILFAGHPDIQSPTCPSPRADFDCSGFSTALDLTGMIDHLFASGEGPCDPCEY